MQMTRCEVCTCPTRADWPRCGYCGAQRLLDHDGTLLGHARYAGFWRRATAAAIDTLIVIGPFALVLWLLPDEQRLDLVAVAITVALLYPLVITSWSADTWGKRILRAHVVEEDGSPIGHGRASAREGVGKIVELLLFAPVGAAGLAAAAFDSRKQALHDKMAGTVCVRGRPRALPRRLG